MTQHFSFLDFGAIENQDDLRDYTENIVMSFYEQSMTDEKGLKSSVAELLKKVHNQITNVSSSPKSKLMSLLLLKELSEKHSLNRRKEDKNSKLFSVLSSHEILTELKNIAENVDPYKKITDKGMNYFPSDRSIGNDYIRLILELIRFWASRFPETSKKEPTKYKKYLDDLVNKKVVFPTDYKFLTFANKNNPNQSDTARYRTGQQQETAAFATPTPTGPPTGRSTIKAEIFHVYSRLLNFVEALDDEASAVEPEIRKTHSQIKNEIKKYEGMEQEIYEIIDKDPETTRKYFAVVQFMHKELQYHQQYISSSNMDFPSYVLAIKLEAEKNFPQLNGIEPSPQLPPQQPKKTQPNPSPSTSRYRQTAVSSLPPPPSSSSKIEPKKVSIDPKTINSVTSYFEKLQERSKSPIAGFKKISESLSKEKAIAVKRSVSPINKSKNSFTKSMASLKQSKVSPIFANPPNLYPPSKDYQGREIEENDAIKIALKSISKSQGLRRFKTANFKGKSSLFENQHIQIGFKSQAVYEQVSNFKVIIKIELYIGNLCDERIQDLALEFKGDQNVLLYASPRTIQSSIARGDQNKIDLIIIPVKVPFPLLTMTMRYSTQGEFSQHRIIIPNSVLKLAHFMNVSKQQFGKRWVGSDIIKAPSSKLCHYLPPDTFSKWIPQLGELSSYTAFAAPGSKKDYELYCVIILMQRYESLLKISIRPNLEFVVQLGIEDKTEESTQYFTYLLQTLQQLLQQVA